MKRIFIAWGKEAELSKYLAQGLEADFKQIYIKKIAGLPIPALIRYIIQGFWTVFVLLWRRPKVVIVQNPPIFASFLILIYTKIFRAKMMIDTHTAAFWDKKWISFHWLFKFTARHADLNTCHNYKNLEILQKWGVKPAMVLQFYNPHYNTQELEDRLSDKDLDEKINQASFPIMMVNRFAGDDDWQTVFKTAQLMPEATFFITGTPNKEAKKIIADKKIKNIYLTGYLRHKEFIKLMKKCAVILTFTLRRDTVLWSIREVLALNKPFVTTDSEVLRHYFDDVGLFVSPQSPEKLKNKIRQAIKDKEDIIKKQKIFLSQDKKRWDEEIEEVKKILKI